MLRFGTKIPAWPQRSVEKSTSRSAKSSAQKMTKLREQIRFVDLKKFDKALERAINPKR
jgi:hypothetical protein